MAHHIFSGHHGHFDQPGPATAHGEAMPLHDGNVPARDAPAKQPAAAKARNDAPFKCGYITIISHPFGIYGDLGDGLSLLYPHYPSIVGFATLNIFNPFLDTPSRSSSKKC